MIHMNREVDRCIDFEPSSCSPGKSCTHLRLKTGTQTDCSWFTAAVALSLIMKGCVFFVFATAGNDQHNQYFLAQTVEAGGVPGACLVPVPFMTSSLSGCLVSHLPIDRYTWKSTVEMNIFVIMILSDHTKTPFPVTVAVFMVNVMLEGHFIYPLLLRSGHVCAVSPVLCHLGFPAHPFRPDTGGFSLSCRWDIGVKQMVSESPAHVFVCLFVL